MKPLLPSKTSRGPVTPRIARNAACVAANAVAGIGEPLPVRQLAGARHAQRVQRRAGDRDRVGGAPLIEAERARDPGGDRVGALRGVIEALGAHRRHLGQAVLDLVGDRQRGQQRATVGVRVLGRGEHRREVVARMAGLAGRQVGVVEVQVAHQRAVVERRAIGRALARADQRRTAAPRRTPAPARGPSPPARRQAHPSATPSESSTRSLSCSRAGSEMSFPTRDRQTNRASSSSASFSPSLGFTGVSSPTPGRRPLAALKDHDPEVLSRRLRSLRWRQPRRDPGRHAARPL